MKNLAKNKALWIVGGILGLSCCGLVGPWVLLWGLFVSEDLAKDYKLRRYQPTSLPDAVAYKYATPELVAGFIEKGADVNQKLPGVNGAPPFPLISAATATDNVEVARLLLHRGAHVEDANVWRCTRDGKEPMTRMLVEEGAALGRQPSYEEGIGPELIQAAAFGGQAWLVRLIAQKGGDVQIVNAGGEGLLALALQSEYHDSLETVQALLAAGAHVDPLSERETPPLFWAASRGKLKDLDLLLAAGVRVDAPVAHWLLKDLVLPPAVHMTALSAAVEYCHHDVAEHLLSHGASKSAVIYDGKSLTQGACYHALDSEKDQRERMRALVAR